MSNISQNLRDPKHLSDCPFCGGKPAFTSAYSEDGNRYMHMDLECCVKMVESIPYRVFREMSTDEINYQLRERLSAAWEDRPQPEGAGIDLIKYSQGDPSAVGVYACRVPSDSIPGFYEDKFLMWMSNVWSYPGSDSRYRGEVVGWIGPLQRRMVSQGSH